MALINLPEIAGIVGAVYDSEKSQDEQSEACLNWANSVAFLTPRNIVLSEFQELRIRKRYTKSVYDYEGVRLSLTMTFVDEDLSKNTYLAYSSQIIGIIQKI